MATSQDMEITLGVGKMLGLFFALVVICAIFFSLGYSVGRVAGKPAPDPTAPNAAAHPAPAKTDSAPVSNTSQLTFYKTVGQKEGDVDLASATDKNDAPPPTAPAAAPESRPAAEPPPASPSPSTVTMGYYVQVAAVTKQEDAEALVSALKKKSFAVFAA